MVNDYLRDRMVMWGGVDANGTGQADTWEFDGTNWQQRSTAHTPYGNGRGAMAYDRSLACVVLVLVNLGQTQTWHYDGVDWLQVSPATTPSSSGQDLMVYDASRGVVVMWVQGNGSGAGETWEYDGFDWTRRLTAAAPPQRYDAGMVFDPLRGRTILHGGFVYGASPSITWEYDGNNWTAGPNAATNPAKTDFAFTFDAHRRRAVLFGGTGYPYSTATYEYDAPNWTLRTSVGPSNRTGAAMAYDQVRQECVLFGGRDTSFSIVSSDTYRYRALAPASAVVFGQGCSGTSVAPGLLPQPYHVPYTGMNFGVQLYSLPYNQPSFVAAGFSRTTYAGLPLPLSLTTIGMTGCQLLVSGDVTLGTMGAGSNASLTLPIPLQPALVGAMFYLQGFALDLGGNPANVIDTRALECRVGSA